MAPVRSIVDFPLFAGLTAAQRGLIQSTARQVRFLAGQRMFAEGQIAAECWLIREGRVALDTEVPGRGPVVIQTLGPGDIVGWSWLVPPFRWNFGGMAITDVLAVALDVPKLRMLAEQDPAFGYPLTKNLFRVLLDRLQGTRARLLDLYGDHA